MAETDDKTDRQVWGAALRALRIRAGKTLAEAAVLYEPLGYTPGDPDKGMSVQRWQQIEKGNAKFTDDQRRRLAKAAGGDLDELEMERARILGHRRPARAAHGGGEREGSGGLVIPIWGRTELAQDGWKVTAADVSERGFNLSDLAVPSVGVTHLADDTMLPKAGPGATVIFDRSRRPKVDAGCVVETTSGEIYPRIYVGEDKDHILVRSIAKPKPVAFRRGDVRGVYAVLFWGD